MSQVIERLRCLIRDRFNRDFEYVALSPYSDIQESPIVDLVIRNRKARKIISEDHLILPIRSGDELFGAAIIRNAITLPESDVERVVDMVEMMMTGFNEATEQVNRVRQLESYLSSKLLSGLDRTNIVYLQDVKTKHKPLQDQIRVGRHQGAFLTQILIEGKVGTPFKEIAFDIHQRSGRSSFISWDDLDSSKLTQPNDIAELGPITIFIPNLSQLNSAEQVVLDKYLLDFMDESTPRIMAAIQSPLSELMEKGILSRGLGFYFSKVHLRIPPLVERKEDILELVDFFSRAHSQGQRNLRTFGLETLSYLTEYDWPGNEKELEFEIRKIVGQIKNEELGNVLGVDSLPVKIVGSEAKQLYRLVKAKTNLKEAAEELETKMVSAALARSGGNKSEASRQLGLSRSALLEKLDRSEKSGGSSRDA